MSFRVLSAEFAHETNTFSRIPTDQQAFRNRCFLTGAEAIAARGDCNTELAGFLQAADDYDWQLDHILSALAGPSGKVTRAAFDWLAGPIVDACGRGHYDGILLGLHGAMVTEFCDDGEAELLRRIRAAAGDEIPIAITLDLHANVSLSMCELADILVSYKTYPHVDMRATARQASAILQACLSGESKPVTIIERCPMLEEVNGGRTDSGPMTAWIERARAWEQRDDVFAVSINGGFASADISELGPSVLVTAAAELPEHRSFAADIAADIWAHRHDVINDYLEVGAAAEIARCYDASAGPLVIADYADNPGAGAYGDATNLLRAMLQAGVSEACFAPLVDSESVQILSRRRPGDRVEIRLGGKQDPNFGGGPVSMEVELLGLSDGVYIGGGDMIGGLRRSFGPSARVRAQGIEILITSIAEQILDLQQFRCFGIEPKQKRVLAIKSMQHFRADFEPIAGQVIVCDSAALCTPDYRRLPYRQVPRPIFPLDQDFEFGA